MRGFYFDTKKSGEKEKMKKIVLTAVVVVFAVAAAQAQDSGARKMASEVFVADYEAAHRTNANAKNQTDSLARQVGDRVTKKVEQENLRRAKQAKKGKQEAKAGKRQQHYNHLPATGAMRDFAEEGRLQEQATTRRAPTDKEEASTARNNRKAKKQGSVRWLARVMGFEKYENETDEEWQARILAMSMK